jgi:hypothetical protein
MSGPIVRKYGFPNFDSIFGKRELEHGAEGPEPTAPKSDDASTDQKMSPAASTPKKDEPAK